MTNSQLGLLMTKGLVSLLCQIATQGSIYSLLQHQFLATLLSLVGGVRKGETLGQLIVPADENK